MQFGRLEERITITAGTRTVTIGGLVILLCTIGPLTVFVFLPQISGDQLPDFQPLETQVRKAEFFAFLDPIVADVSADVSEERAFITELEDRVASGENVSWLARRKLNRIAAYYEVDTEDADIATEVLPTLRQRVDVVPRSLILVQAAKESGWGTSRFALQGNNLFGQRCYSDGCGIAPTGVQPDAGFGVAKFSSVDASVASYVRNLNTHPQYADFRRMRQSLRNANATLAGTVLADGLIDYSERGDAYIAEIKAMILQNSLEPGD